MEGIVVGRCEKCACNIWIETVTKPEKPRLCDFCWDEEKAKNHEMPTSDSMEYKS